MIEPLAGIILIILWLILLIITNLTQSLQEVENEASLNPEMKVQINLHF